MLIEQSVIARDNTAGRLQPRGESRDFEDEADVAEFGHCHECKWVTGLTPKSPRRKLFQIAR